MRRRAPSRLAWGRLAWGRLAWSRLYAAAFAILFLTAGGKAALVELDRAFPPDLAKAGELSSLVRAADGEILRVFPTVDGKIRLPVSLEAVDAGYLDLLVRTEDKRFWRHGGVDPLAVLRAAGQAVRHGRVVSGASTLTMQVARLLEPRPRTLRSKAIEAFRAWQLERRLSKREILETYLRLAPYGGRIEGLRAGSLAWFGKPPTDLSPAEAALLVALPQAPERLRPDRFPEAARAARARLLSRAGRAAEALPPVPRRLRAWPLAAPHLARRLAPEGEATTTLDAGLQRRVQALARHAAEATHPKASAAVLVVELPERSVRAYVGGADFLSSPRQGQVDMVAAARSPGSTLKPLVYGLAFELGLAHPETLVLDAPVRFGSYRPRNFDGDFHGELTLRAALQLSLNIPAVKLLHRIGPAVFVERLAGQGVALDFAGHDWPGLAIALGGAGLSLEELVRLYAGLADDGQARPLRYLATPEPSNESMPLLGKTARAQVADILLGAPRPPGALGRGGIAFKTGTSYGFRDAWAAGFDGRYAVGVWVGRPDGTPLPESSGFRTAAPLLFQVFDLLPGAPLAPLPPDAAPPALAALTPRPPGLAEAAPEIAFPQDGAELRLTDLPEVLPLEATGGRRPLAWLVDGRPVPVDSLGRRGHWQPGGAGFSEIVVVDAAGRRDAVRVRLTERTAGGPRVGRLTAD
jgi:penicillin-binding protein 1C